MQKKYKVRFHDAAELIGNYDAGGYKDKLKDALGISVDVGVWYERSGWIKYSDDSGKPFIKRVYEELQSLVEGKELGINKEMRESRQKLVKNGIIKG